MKKGVGIQVRATDWIQRDVKLGDKANDVDEQAQPRAPDAESSSKGELVHGMTIGSPIGR